MDLRRSMKLSLILGSVGAVIIPFIYEIYANISAGLALFFTAVWAVYAGLKFSSLSFREAFLGITCTIAYSGSLGMVCYFFVHPKIQDMLINRSVYFQLTLSEQAYFLLYVFLIFLLMYIIWLGRFGLHNAIEKLKSNREKTGEYIENAFNDDREDG